MISPSFVQNHHNFSQSVSNCYWLGLTHALKPTCAVTSKCGPFAHSEDSSYEVIEELQHIVWFNQSNLREVIVKNTEIDEFHYNIGVNAYTIIYLRNVLPQLQARMSGYCTQLYTLQPGHQMLWREE